MITTQSESIISPPNKDKVPITNMQLALKIIFEVQSNTNYEGDEVDLVDGDGRDDGADGDVDGDAPLRQGGVVMTMASISPSPEAPVWQDLPSPRVGEDFRLRYRLNKSREKYGLGFWVKRRHR